MSRFDRTWKDQDHPIVINLDVLEAWAWSALAVGIWALLLEWLS